MTDASRPAGSSIIRPGLRREPLDRALVILTVESVTLKNHRARTTPEPRQVGIAARDERARADERSRSAAPILEE